MWWHNTQKLKIKDEEKPNIASLLQLRMYAETHILYTLFHTIARARVYIYVD